MKTCAAGLTIFSYIQFNFLLIINSAKKETSSDFQLFLLSVNVMCVNICMNTKRVNTIRHKLKMFHRHVTNRNRIMCPWMKGGSKSKVPVSIWCGHQLLEVLQCISSSWTGPDLSVLAVRCYPTLPPRHLQVLKHVWGTHGYTHLSFGVLESEMSL